MTMSVVVFILSSINWLIDWYVDNTVFINSCQSFWFWLPVQQPDHVEAEICPFSPAISPLCPQHYGSDTIHSNKMSVSVACTTALACPHAFAQYSMWAMSLVSASSSFVQAESLTSMTMVFVTWIVSLFVCLHFSKCKHKETKQIFLVHWVSTKDCQLGISSPALRTYSGLSVVWSLHCLSSHFRLNQGSMSYRHQQCEYIYIQRFSFEWVY